MKPVNSESFCYDQMFELTFCNNEIRYAKIQEDEFFALFYVNESIYSGIGKEFCIALDVALATSGCEAVVEGFYSVMKAHKKAGGQSNEVLVERVIVDWSLPHPFICKEAIRNISKI